MSTYTQTKRQFVSETSEHDPSLQSLHCPMHTKCAELDNIIRDYSPKNVFIAIPYSNDYPYENSIIEVIKKGGLTPLLAKDLLAHDMHCKVCIIIRICHFMVVDWQDGNSNVMYELGKAEALGKIIAILKPSIIPSDLQGIEYLNHDGSHASLKIELGKWFMNKITEPDQRKLARYLRNLATGKYGL